MSTASSQSKPPPNPCDQAARFLARLDPLGFLCWLFKVVDPAFRFSRWLDTRTVPFPGARDRTCDTVAELLDPTQPRWIAACPVEFQARPDPDMCGRLGEYVGRLAQALRKGRGRLPRYGFLAGLVNLTGRPKPQGLVCHLPGAPHVCLHFGIAERNLAGESAAALLADIAARKYSYALLGFVPLMQGGSEVATIEEWKRVAAMERSAMLRANYRDLALVFAELARNKTIWDAELKGWNAMRSALVDNWKAEGRAEGRVEGEQRIILALGRKRLGEPDAAAVQRLERIVDESELQRLALRVADVETWGDLLER